MPQNFFHFGLSFSTVGPLWVGSSSLGALLFLGLEGGRAGGGEVAPAPPQSGFTPVPPPPGAKYPLSSEEVSKLSSNVHSARYRLWVFGNIMSVRLYTCKRKQKIHVHQVQL